MSLLDALQSILGTAGNVLDTPGSVARGLLAGDPGAALGGVFDPSQRISGRDMLERWGALGPNEEGLDLGDALGFGAELLTDPMNLVMPLAGKALAGKALARGPMYEKGLATLKGAGVPAEQLGELLQLPLPALRELPPGSKYLGHGAEATAFKTPMGDVARFEYTPALRGELDPIPVSPDILQPHRDVFYDFPKEIMLDAGPANIRGVRVQRMPFARDVGQASWEETKELSDRLKNQNIRFFDRHAGNVGRIGMDQVPVPPREVTVPIINPLEGRYGLPSTFAESLATAAAPPFGPGTNYFANYAQAARDQFGLPQSALDEVAAYAAGPKTMTVFEDMPPQFRNGRLVVTDPGAAVGINSQADLSSSLDFLREQIAAESARIADVTTPPMVRQRLQEQLLELQASTDEVAAKLANASAGPATRGPITAQRPGALMEQLMDMLGYTGYTRQLAAGQDAMNPMLYGIAGYNAARPLSMIQQGGYPGLGNSLPLPDEFPGDKWWPSTAPGNFM